MRARQGGVLPVSRGDSPEGPFRMHLLRTHEKHKGFFEKVLS